MAAIVAGAKTLADTTFRARAAHVAGAHAAHVAGVPRRVFLARAANVVHWAVVAGMVFIGRVIHVADAPGRVSCFGAAHVAGAVGRGGAKPSAHWPHIFFIKIERAKLCLYHDWDVATQRPA